MKKLIIFMLLLMLNFSICQAMIGDNLIFHFLSGKVTLNTTILRGTKINYTNITKCADQGILKMNGGFWTCSSDSTGTGGSGKAADNFYLTNDSTTIFFNETLLNSTIDNRAGSTTDTNESPFINNLKGNCSAGQKVFGIENDGTKVCTADITGTGDINNSDISPSAIFLSSSGISAWSEVNSSALDTNCTASNSCPLITYDSELTYNTTEDIWAIIANGSLYFQWQVDTLINNNISALTYNTTEDIRAAQWLPSNLTQADVRNFQWQPSNLTQNDVRSFQLVNTTSDIQNAQNYWNNTDASFGNLYANFYDWTSADTWNIFNGHVLDFNESKLSSNYYNTSSFHGVKGTVDGGYLNYTFHSDGDFDGVTFNFSEETGSPGLDIRMNFTGISDFNYGIMRYKTSTLAGEFPIVQLWSYTDSKWDDYPAVVESIAFAVMSQPIFHAEDYISNGIVQMRIYKSSNGNTQNHYFVDWISISQGYGVPSGEEVDPVWVKAKSNYVNKSDIYNGTLQTNITYQVCTGNDKFSGFNGGVFTCSADSTGGGGVGLWQTNASYIELNLSSTGGVNNVKINNILNVTGKIYLYDSVCNETGCYTFTDFTSDKYNTTDDIRASFTAGANISIASGVISIVSGLLDDLKETFIELTDSFGGEVSGTYDNIVLDNNALDDQYIELLDNFGGDVSGTYDALLVIDTQGLGGENITAGTVADARIASTITRDSELDNNTIIRAGNTTWITSNQNVNTSEEMQDAVLNTISSVNHINYTYDDSGNSAVIGLNSSIFTFNSSCTTIFSPGGNSFFRACDS